MNQEIVVLGAGESGVGAAILAKKQGRDVFVSDSGAIAPRYRDELQEWKIEFEEGGHSEERILNAKEIIKSPGIPDKSPLIKKLIEKGIPIISEIEYAGRFTQSTLIAITGSNGKTTTTCWIYHLLQEAGLDASLAGNVGVSLARQIAVAPHEYYVIELSSFQLDHMYSFKNHIAVLLNITPDHLDRYNYSFDEYAEAKMRILQNMGRDDYFVYWQEDRFISQWLGQNPQKCTLLPFTTQEDKTVLGHLEENSLVIETGDGESFVIDRGELALPGRHNLQNAMAVAMVAYALHIPASTIRRALRNYKNIAHRMESVAIINGVSYINDSKATNVNSTWYALESVRTPVILILGGTDKGNDYSDIMDLVREKVRAMVFLTKDTEKLHRSFDSMVSQISEALSMEEAVRKAQYLADFGDTVLLSPACASFDLFKNYEDRGDQFKSVVLKINNEQKKGGD